LRLYKITVSDPYTSIMSGVSAGTQTVSFDQSWGEMVIGATKAATGRTKWTTIVPETHYQEAIAVAATKCSVPFHISVEIMGELDD
jgi:hypothetical protein